MVGVGGCTLMWLVCCWVGPLARWFPVGAVKSFGEPHSIDSSLVVGGSCAFCYSRHDFQYPVWLLEIFWGWLMGPHGGLSLRGGTGCPAPHWNLEPGPRSQDRHYINTVHGSDGSQLSLCGGWLWVAAPVRAKIWSSEKVDLGEYYLTLKSVNFLGQSSPDFLRQTWKESRSITYMFDFEDICRLSLKLSKIRPNFAYFWPLKWFSRGLSKILDQDYKIEHTSHHGAQFRGNRPTEFGNLVEKKKNKINPSKT